MPTQTTVRAAAGGGGAEREEGGEDEALEEMHECVNNRAEFRVADG
jgi:hypothetical protein